MQDLVTRFPLDSNVVHVTLPQMGVGIVKGHHTTPVSEDGPAVEWLDVKFPDLRLVTFYADSLRLAA